jgi:hypothetical protein
MMDLSTQIETLLRSNDYFTRLWTGNKVPTVCLENKTILGFIYIFEFAEDLVSNWEDIQKTAFEHHAEMLHKAGEKAWNIYSIFLAENSNTELFKQIELIEEDFTYSRKIARTGIQTQSDITEALLPLLSIQSHPSLNEVIYEDRLRVSLNDLPQETVTAFLRNSDIKPSEVAQMLVDGL